MGLLALPLLLDKAIAHTKGMLEAKCGCTNHDVALLLSPSQQRNFARISSMKIISITPFSLKSFRTTAVVPELMQI
jgi:hypothetical protein